MVRTAKPTSHLRLGRLPLAVLVIVLGLTVGGFVLAQRWVDRSEEKSLEEAAAGAVAVVSSFGRQIEAILYAGSVIVDATEGDPDTFMRAITDRIEGTAITNITLLESDGGELEPVASAGEAPALLLPGLTDADRSRLDEIARSPGDIRIVKIAEVPEGRVVGFATPSGEEGRFVIYAESLVPALDNLYVFRLPKGVDFATYLGEPSDATLIQATTEQLPISGRTVEQSLLLGSEEAVIVVGGGEGLVGGLTAGTPWIVLAGGIVVAAGLALLLELMRRRREAESAQRSLVEQNARLRELDRLKDELVATVSHELRTPLTSILGYLELIREEPDGMSDEHRSFLDVVERNARRLLNLVSDLLFVARIDAGRLELEIDEVDVRVIATECVEAQRPRAERGGITVGLEVGDVPLVHGDRARLVQLLDNLVSNAIKFTPGGGSVEVAVLPAGEQVELVVSDTGMGIPVDEQARLFERFYRSSVATEAAIQGTGLGLTIAKAIVDAHGGEIAIESAEGEGTTFRVTLPVEARPVGFPGAAEALVGSG